MSATCVAQRMAMEYRRARSTSEKWRAAPYSELSREPQPEAAANDTRSGRSTARRSARSNAGRAALRAKHRWTVPTRTARGAVTAQRKTQMAHRWSSVTLASSRKAWLGQAAGRPALRSSVRSAQKAVSSAPYAGARRVPPRRRWR